MVSLKIPIALSLVVIFLCVSGEGKYDKRKEKTYFPTWASLDSRPLPEWYDQGKIGIFLHWGLYSVPAHFNAWFWYYWKTAPNKELVEFMAKNYKPGFTYYEFAPMFTAQFYDPDFWADLFVRAGAKYVVLTNKHHEGYALWPSSHGFNWNSVDIGPHRDLVGDLAQAVRKTDVKFGLYNSLLEWHQPLYERDRANNWTTRDFAEFKAIPTLQEMVTKYQPEVIWSDGEWEAPDKYWGAEEFLAWLYNESPVKNTVVTNDRWGAGTQGKHGGFYNFADKFNPGVLVPHKWENAMTVDKYAWMYRADAKLEDYLTPEELINTLVMTIACGGNLLVDVGPTKEGTIAAIMQERLVQMGEWLKVNGEAIYSSVPWTSQNDTLTKDVWYTTNQGKTKIYAISTKWPGKELTLKAVSGVTGMTIQMLGSTGNLEWEKVAEGGIKIMVPRPDENESKWAWTFVINNTP